MAAEITTNHDQRDKYFRANEKIILGAWARKTRSKSFEAFSSINYPLPGLAQDGRVIRYIRPEAWAVTAKLMWIPGQTMDRKWVEELFYTPVACDILTGE